MQLVGDIGIARRHFPPLLNALGHQELAKRILDLCTQPLRRPARADIPLLERRDAAITALLETPRVQLDGMRDTRENAFVGGFLTAHGPLRALRLSDEDQRQLAALGVGLTYMGVSHRMLKAVIMGAWAGIVEVEPGTGFSVEESELRGDGGGTWLLTIGERVVRG